MTGSVYNNRRACHCTATDTFNKGSRLQGPNTGRVGFASYTDASDVDIVTAGSEIDSSICTQDNVV